MKSLKVHVLSKLLNRDMLVKVLHRRVLLGSVDDLCNDLLMICVMICVMIGDGDDGDFDDDDNNIDGDDDAKVD